MLSQIALLPNFKDDSSRQQFLKNLEYAGTDPSDILKPSSTGSSEADIKKALGG